MDNPLAQLRATGKKKDAAVPLSEQATGASSATKKSPQVRISKNIYRQRAFRQAASFFSYAVLAVLVVYLCFALTLLRVLPTTSAGFIPVKNLTVPGGIVPPGQQLAVNVKDAPGDTMLDRAKQSLLMTGDAAVVEVVAGPYGKLNWTPAITTVDGKKLPYSLTYAPKKEYLENEYVVQCVKGACIPETTFIIPKDNVYGQPLITYEKKKFQEKEQ